jgi:predicted nucleic-acid-binding protein
VRFLVRDDEARFEKANRLIKREVGAKEAVFVNLLVLLETEWVLRSRYNLQKKEIMEAISGLLDDSLLRAVVRFLSGLSRKSPITAPGAGKNECRPAAQSAY